MRATLGICVIAAEPDSPAREPEMVLRDADAALRQAKLRAHGRLEIFDAALREDTQRRLRDETDLETAIDAGQLTLHYQPIVDLRAGQVRGAEALVRWQRPGHGMIVPSDFIPLAEETGLILDLGRWVLRRACGDAAQWSRTAPALVAAAVSVNVSALQLVHPRFAHDVESALGEAGLPPDRLILEVTESLLIADSDPIIAVLAALRDRGIRVALDDFGTGYSSLGYLQRLPADILKIDKSFIDSIRGPADGTALSEAVLKLGQALDLRTVAEGVEAPEQVAALRQMGCDWAQGFAFARPVPNAELQAACENASRARGPSLSPCVAR